MNTVIFSALLLSHQFAGANKETVPAPIGADFNLVAVGRNNTQMDQQIWKSGSSAIPAGMRTAMVKALKKMPKMEPDVHGFSYVFGFTNSPGISNATIEVSYDIISAKGVSTRSFGSSVYGWRSSATGFLLPDGQIRMPKAGERSQLSITFATGSKSALGTLTRGVNGQFNFSGTAKNVRMELTGTNNKMVTLTFEDSTKPVELSVNFVGVRLGQVQMRESNEANQIKIDMTDPKITSASVFMRSTTKKVYRDLPLIPELSL